MSQIITKLKSSNFWAFIKSFSPATQAALIFAIPFTLLDAVHYYTAGTALVITFPLLIVFYLLCGALAAKIALQSGQDRNQLPRHGRSAGLKLWLISTVINILINIFLTPVSLGASIVSGVAYLCLFALLHALSSAIAGWAGGWCYKQYINRISP